jgi:glycosyltransferase involved in cell wall biosynthesis/GT2 family glycosyltransferase
MADVSGIAFSKDRAMQLDAALRSLALHCHDAYRARWTVIYKASTPQHARQYRELARAHPSVAFEVESDFRAQVLALVARADHVAFLVDDNLFVRAFSWDDAIEGLRRHPDALGVSLRLGVNTQYCYPADRPQPLPPLLRGTSALLKFRWTDAECDFGYPLEVSSSLFRSAELLRVLPGLAFSNPNSLEANLAAQRPRYAAQQPHLLCYDASATFCNPANRVQDEYANRAGDSHPCSAADLAELFEKGQRVDVASYAGHVPRGVHEEVALRFLSAAASAESPEPPLVSIVVPCFGQARFLEQAVSSVVAQTYTRWELLIVDDGSPDDTREVAQRLIAAHPDRRIQLISKQNGGVADARNTGVRASRGEYWLPLDADDAIAPTFLEKAVSLLAARPEVGFVYSDIEHFGGETGVYRLPPFDAETLVHLENVCSTCALVRREVFDQVGGYDATLRHYEDWDFWIACAERGWQGHRMPEALFRYRKQRESRLPDSNRLRPRHIAAIVRKHPALYSERRREQAEAILADAAAAEPRNRVLIACTHFWPSVGGLETIAENLGTRLVQRGYAVDVAAWAHPERWFPLHRGMTIHSLALEPATRWRRWLRRIEGRLQRMFSRKGGAIPLWVRRVADRIRTERYAAAILIGDPRNQLLRAGELAGFPHGTRLLLQPLINRDGYAHWRADRPFRDRLATTLRGATAALALSRGGAEAEFMREEEIAPVFVPNATEPLAPAFPFRRVCNIPDDAFLILHVANLWSVKNHLGLLETLSALPGDWRLVLVGHPAGEPDYVAQVQHALRQRPDVLYLPGLSPERVAAAINAADVVVLASKGEVSPVTLLEAMSHAKPWLATPECGAASEHAGGVVAPLAEFPELLRRLRAAPELARALGRVGQRHWQSCYSWPAVIDGFEELIETGALKRSYAAPEELWAEMLALRALLGI